WSGVFPAALLGNEQGLTPAVRPQRYAFKPGCQCSGRLGCSSTPFNAIRKGHFLQYAAFRAYLYEPVGRFTGLGAFACDPHTPIAIDGDTLWVILARAAHDERAMGDHGGAA